jgi:hypothetical protein
MASGINFKTVDPVEQLVATGSGGGGGLPLTGGTLTGNLVMQVPSIVSQCQPPMGPCDLTNKQYVDGLLVGGPFLPLAGGSLSGNLVLTSPAKVQQTQAPTVGDDLVNKTYVDGAFQAKKPAAVSNNVAFFGAGADLGQTIDSGFSVDTNLANPSSNTTLWPSSRIIGALQYGANVYKATASVPIAPGASVRAFSTGSAIMGPSSWPNIGSTFSLAGTGIATITNALEYTTYYRIIFSTNSLSESTNIFGEVQCEIRDEFGPTFITIPKILNCLAAPPAFSNEVYLTCLVSVPPATSFNFSVLLTNLGANLVTVDPIAPDNVCILVIERVA